MHDEDWGIIKTDDPETDVMYALVFGRIGMGTDDPKGRLDIRIAKDGDVGHQYLFEGDEDGDAPTFTIRKYDSSIEDPGQDENQHFVKKLLGPDHVNWINTYPLGYVFKSVRLGNTGSGQGCYEAAMGATGEPMTMMLVTSLPDSQSINGRRPAVKIGDNDDPPQSVLDVENGSRGQILLHPVKKVNSELVLMSKDGSDRFFLSEGVTPEFTVLTTNSGGYCFNYWDMPPADYLEETATGGGDTLMVILNDGKVGIGTKEPGSKLEVHEPERGNISLHLGYLNPALAITNLPDDPNVEPNYLTMGASNSYGAFVTNSEGGFVFRAGGEYTGADPGPGDTLNQKDISDSHGGHSELVYISKQGKVGVGIVPEDTHSYYLDVNGPVRACEIYQLAPENTEDSEPLENVLEDLCTIKAFKYSWEDRNERCYDGQNKIGLDVDDVEGLFSELVTADSNGQRAIAYGNMTAVLVQAIKELKAKVDDQEARITELEDKLENRPD